MKVSHLFLKSYRVLAFAAFAAVLCVVTTLVPANPQPIILTTGLVAEPWPLLLGLVAAGTPLVLASPGSRLEGSLPVRASSLRWGVVGVSGVIAVALITLTTWAIGRPVDLALRNLCLCAAMAFVTAILAGAAWAWAAPIAVTAANWLYGVDDGNQAKPWALLMQAEDDVLLLSSVVLAVAAAAFWAWRGSVSGDG